MKQFHLGAFTSYDENELDTLKELQWRASSYVQYYIKYAKVFQIVFRFKFLIIFYERIVSATV